MKQSNNWQHGSSQVSVIMISLNEEHNMDAVLKNLSGWAYDVHLVDSCSQDNKIDIALKHGVNVIQHRFNGFGDQWNFALDNLPISTPWVMKLDPDERLTPELKKSIDEMIKNDASDGIIIKRRLWFMGSVLPITQSILRLWRTGTCHFTEVKVNEHPLVEGDIHYADGYLEHHDSPHLDHWVVKQNKYTTTEAINQFYEGNLAASPKLFGTSLERRIWIKKNFWKIPGRYIILFLYHFIFLGAWRAGRIGWIWSHLRVEVYRLWGFKKIEMKLLNGVVKDIPAHAGNPDTRVRFYE